MSADRQDGSPPQAGMQALVRAFDWSRTPLGPMPSWPKTLRTLVDLLLVQPIPMILLWGPDLTQIYNDAYAVIAANKHPKALGQPNRECWPEALPLTEPIYQRVLRNGERVLLDDHPIPLDRLGKGMLEEAYFTVSYSPAFDDEGRIGGIFVTVVETTHKVLGARDRERRAAEEQLRRGYETFYNLIHDDPFGVYVVDADFRLAHVSRGAQKVFANVRPLIGRDFAEVLRIVWPEPFATEAVERFRHTLASGEPYAAPRTIERRNDIAVTEAYDWRISRIGLPDGRPGVVCYFYDLSERQAYEAALKAADERADFLARAIDSSTQPFGSGRPDGSLMVLNPAFCALTGYSSEELRTLSWRDDLTPPEWHEREARVLQKLHETGEPVVYEKEYIRKNGTRVPIEVNAHLVRDTDGKPLYYYSFVTDISARKATEAALRRAKEEAEHISRMKDEFLATLSHELRTPLNAILGWSQIMERSGDDAETIREGISIIGRNAKVQTQLIEDLLDMSRIISGKLRLDVKQVNAGDVVADAVEAVAPTAAAKNIRIEKVVDPKAGPVSGDPARLQQVVWNLLTNALKFTPKGGKVQVTLERVNSHVEVTVSDTGQGITPEFLPFIFERFRQADATTTRKHGGLGLGLSIVKQIVELHGGTVRAKSPGEGRGATFIFTLPLAIARFDTNHMVPKPAAEGTAEACDEIDLDGVHVLCVDDDPDSRSMCKRILAECRARVSVAASAPEALERLQADRPDVLVSDIGMPEFDGYELIRRVRELPPDRGGEIPAAALTAFARSEDRRRALRAGYQSHVAKPVEPLELVTVVASLVGKAGKRS